MHSTSLLVAFICLAGLTSVAPGIPQPGAACPVLFEGRVALTTTAADFDKNTSVYNNLYDLGQNQTWAEVLKFPAVAPSLFDLTTATKSFEVTIDDESIFVPGGGEPQVGFRRSELLPAVDLSTNGNASTVQGTTTFHWSVRTDSTRPLNYSHEYHPVWHEYADYSSSQFTITAGVPFSTAKDPKITTAKSLRVAGLQSNTPETTFFQTLFTDDVWHNFALTMGWVDNTITVYYSEGYAPLELVAGPAFNNNTGGGAFHVGILKEPTGPLGIDVLYQGYQESGINEGLIFGGVFIENSDDGCVTLSL
ncbi:glycoside hydrolase family 131 protein [Daedalea quercina L-15889]|uniref:Glycoside hydrolase family 131 protein n=1 Tax=Daedalea quercina L-15889 TaxID=1314783 RepID=A0A165LMF5_9APHY|nr:glycoside hydrolase family 131 protein [Daedalea quercina L-15889]